MSATTTTIWTGVDGGTWDSGENWSADAPTVDGNPIWPGEVAVITVGSAIYNDATLDATTVVLDGAASAPVLLYFADDGTTLDSGVILTTDVDATVGIAEANGDLDNQGTMIASGTGSILQFDPVTASNALIRELWTSEGMLRATNGGTLEIGQTADVQDDESKSNMLPEFDYLQSNGLILADDGGTVQLNTSAGSKGEIIASGGTILVAAAPELSGVAQAYNALVTVPGPGVLYIANAGVLEDAGGIGEPIFFTDGTGLLVVDPGTGDVLPLVGPIENFQPGDTIELGGSAISNLAYVFGAVTLGQPGTLTFDIGSVAEQITLDGDYRQDVFSITANGDGIEVSGPASSGRLTDAVTDSGGASHSIAFGSASVAALAKPLLADIAPSNALFIDAAGSKTMAAGQTAAVIDASGFVYLTGNSEADETIAAGAGAFDFLAGTGSGTVLGGNGADLLYFAGGGDWRASLGDGVDTVVASAGSDTIGTGTGGSLIFLGSGASSVGSAGDDTIVGAAGSATVSVMGANSDELFALGGPLEFFAGSGASTVDAGAAAVSAFGGASGGSLIFARGDMQYFGSGAADTVVGLTGSDTIYAGDGGGVFLGGTAGNNEIIGGAGEITAFGAGSGDQLIASGAGANLFAGGDGAETLTGVGSSGQNTFFAGAGPETLAGGSGETALVAGTGVDLFEPGTGVTLVVFAAGQTAGASDTISGWDPSHDFVQLDGYGAPDANVAAGAIVRNGSATIALSDGTHVTFAGVTQLDGFSFI